MNTNRAGTDVETRARSWLAAEPDEDVRSELRSLLDGEPSELIERFSGGLSFGTAGLRAAIGAGPRRMNRLVVRQAAAGIVDVLMRDVDGAAERGLLIGYDARHKSRDFAFDTARVAAARGMRVKVCAQPVPTPVLAWNITQVGAAAGIMVTASHNPAGDNGYKVFLGTGAQIVPPWDALFATGIAALDPVAIELADPASASIEIVGDELVEDYLAAIAGIRFESGLNDLRVAYTALHGVGGEVALRAFSAAGFDSVWVVAAQQDPDADFPTVSFPNPEEPGAMDLVVELARASSADIALAHDPDGDRLGVAVPLGSGSARSGSARSGDWRLLTGDEIGWLLADHILRHTSGDDRLVVTTLVSSSLLGKMAQAEGVHFAETFTGFKWIADAVVRRPDLRLVFAYEQALGYLVTGRPLDKDGITAAVVMADLAAHLKAQGLSIEDRLDEIAARFGRHVTAETSVRMDPELGVRAVAAMRANPPTQVGDRRVISVEDYSEASLLRLWVEGRDGVAGGESVRLQVRPSGTEPKVKIYGEAVGEDPAVLSQLISALTSLL